MAVLVLTRSDDRNVEGVIGSIQERGVRAFRLDTDGFPTEVQLILEYGRSSPRLRLTSRLQEFLDYFGLQYGAFDLILTPDGQYVFLELNPSGEFFWLDSVVGLPISKAIADVLPGEHRRPLR
jgi:hypothetical protein